MPRLVKKAFWLPSSTPYFLSELSDSHDETLYQFGEYVMIAMMWRLPDFEAGLVGRCSVCSVTGVNLAADRIAKAYGYQSDQSACPSCFGTSFEGGLRALVIRPSIISDRDTVTSAVGRRGEVTTDTVSVETTSDIFTRVGDYLFRADNTRYRLTEMSNLVVRTGFDEPDRAESIGGFIATAQLEDPASIAYSIDPVAGDLQRILRDARAGRHLPNGNLHDLDFTPGPLIP